MAKIVVLYSSACGPIGTRAQAIAEGADGVEDRVAGLRAPDGR